MIEITCLEDGFRRGGVAHPKGTKQYDDDTFSLKQLAEMEAEPLLHVMIIEGEQDDPAQGVANLSKDERLVLAISKLDEKEKDHFTQDGKPRPGALGDLIGETVSGAERDRAWNIYRNRKESNE